MSAESHLYEYAVIRYVPSIEREEFINVGLLMMCKRKRWIRAKIVLPHAKLSAYHCDIPLDIVEQQLMMFPNISEGKMDAGPMATMEVEERFRWLAAVKSACIQTSRPHPGITDNLDETFNALMDQLVL